jgi:hypothetical protein
MQAPAIAQSALPPAVAPEQVLLRYAAGAGCPSQPAFVNEVASRVRRPIEWVTVHPSTEIVITIGQTGDHATGTLEIITRSGEPTRREFVASNCSEIGAALALVAALTLDPNARTEPLVSAAPGSPVAPEPPVETVAPPREPEVAPAPTAPRPVASPLAPPVARRSEPSARYVAWLGPAVGVGLGYASEPLVTWGVSLGARSAVRSGFSPSFQLTPMWGKTGSTGPAAPDGTFAWAMARLAACPAELRPVPALSLEACAAGEVGRVAARGDAPTVEPVAVDRWWLAAGANLALHFSLGSLFGRVETQALFPATRDQFVFHDPDRRIHQAGVLVYGASLGVGVELGR